jgi:hypothetical protein
MKIIWICSSYPKWIFNCQVGDTFQKYPDLLVDFSGLIFEAEDSGDFNNENMKLRVSIPGLNMVMFFSKNI